MSRSGLLSELRQVVTTFFENCRCNLADESDTPTLAPTCPCPSLTSWTLGEHQNYLVMCSGKKCSWIIPLGGNAFINSSTGEPEVSPEIVSPCGLANWTNPNTIISSYFHSTRPGEVLIALRLRVPYGSSKLKITVTPTGSVDKNKPQRSIQGAKIDIKGKDYQLVPCGKFTLYLDGYMRIDLQGVIKTGDYFADVSHILIIPESHWFEEETSVKFVADPQDFYFGRRGPSVHLQYPEPTEGNFEYFYTELLVPRDQDVIGAYFCAAGFQGGYFGIQVNSSSERRVLFSIWSAWQTDNPGDIPDEYKIKLIKKGQDVIIGEFGDEGSGGQSYLKYPWISEVPYRFLIYATPLDADNTIYTAWFNPSNGNGDPMGWQLIASFQKPKDSTYLKGLYAFSENFIPEMGAVERLCVYGNQWICDSQGRWLEVTKSRFTADATANAKNRMDICAGVHSQTGQFFLRNCGFFSDAIEPNVEFQREPLGVPPQVDFGTLP